MSDVAARSLRGPLMRENDRQVICQVVRMGRCGAVESWMRAGLTMPVQRTCPHAVP